MYCVCVCANSILSPLLQFCTLILFLLLILSFGFFLFSVHWIDNSNLHLNSILHDIILIYYAYTTLGFGLDPSTAENINQ